MICSKCRRDVLGGDEHGCREAALEWAERALWRETEKRERFEEEVWCAHKWLDDQSIPRADVGGEVFSLVGRMMRLAKMTV